MRGEDFFQTRMCGRNALRACFAKEIGREMLDRARLLSTALERHPPPGLREWTIAYGTLLVEFTWDTNLEAKEMLGRVCEALQMVREAEVPEMRRVEIPVRYDGCDLETFAKAKGLTPEQVAEIHSEGVYYVYQIGFAPGFPYLGPLDERLCLSRRATPRTRVPAGAVAIGGRQTGIYPRELPGGWHVIGTTDVALFSPEAGDERAFLLHVGDEVRFVSV